MLRAMVTLFRIPALLGCAYWLAYNVSLLDEGLARWGLGFL